MAKTKECTAICNTKWGYCMTPYGCKTIKRAFNYCAKELGIVPSSPNFVGFIFEHNIDDLSLWLINLSEEDRQAIEEILMKYVTDGFSIRGDITYKGIGFQKGI